MPVKHNYSNLLCALYFFKNIKNIS